MGTDNRNDSTVNSLVSVCVASYNNYKYITYTLDSILKQSYRPLEIIIVDDCSKDNSVNEINTWIKLNELSALQNDCIIKFFTNSKNSGVCHTFNVAIGNSKGSYINIIASDDLMLPEKVSIQVSILEKAHENVGLVYSDAYLIGPNDEPYFGKFIQRHKPDIIEIPQGNLLGDLLQDNFVPVMSILWKKECFKRCGIFDENLVYEDYDMLLRISREYKFIFSDFISVRYRLHSNNLHKRRNTIAWAESNFILYFKHLGAENKSHDLLIQQHLRRALIDMYNLKSKNIRIYFDQYYEYFKDDKMMRVALSCDLPYHQLLRFQKIFTKLVGKNSS